jgi:translocator protein
VKSNDIVKLIICCSVPLAIGFTGSFFTNSSLDWYQTLAKPVFTPPSWVFAPVWTALYLLMGIAAFLVWRKGLTSAAGKTAIAAFILQLVFNALWVPIFFGAKQPLFAFMDIVVLWLAVITTIVSFKRVSKPAAILLIPYMAWVSFATVLNAGIYMLNR